jgi:hypothetical protein
LIELVLVLHKGLAFLSLRALTYCYLLLLIYFIANYKPKTPKRLHPFIILLVNLSCAWEPLVAQRKGNDSQPLRPHGDFYHTPTNVKHNLPSIAFNKESDNDDTAARIGPRFPP